jgi:hypothetical protein
MTSINSHTVTINNVPLLGKTSFSGGVPDTPITQRVVGTNGVTAIKITNSHVIRPIEISIIDGSESYLTLRELVANFKNTNSPDYAVPFTISYTRFIGENPLTTTYTDCTPINDEENAFTPDDSADLTKTFTFQGNLEG